MARFALIILAFVLVALVADIGVIFINGFSTPSEEASVAVILGNKVYADGTPSPRLQARLDEGVLLYQTGKIKRIIVSGGVEENGLSEAQVMAGYLSAHGVPSDVIAMDDTGRNTHLSAVALSKMLSRETPIIVVSQWFHIARTKLAMRQCHFTKISGAAPHYLDARDIYSLLRETLALPYYAVTHKGC